MTPPPPPPPPPPPAPIPPQERVLDWRSYHDPRSRDYPVRTLITPDPAAPAPLPKSWRLGAVLDQGREGACVGFAHTADLLASPRPAPLVGSLSGAAYAVDVYHRAKELDEFPGTDYEGTSVLAGARVIRERQFIDGFTWCFSIDDLRDAILHIGPTVIGIPWYEDMYTTAPNGVVHPGGPLVGGHCLLVYGYHPAMRIFGEPPRPTPSTPTPDRFEVFKWRNSWGPTYGRNGNGIVHAADLRDLLADQGEACCAVGRHRVREALPTA